MSARQVAKCTAPVHTGRLEPRALLVSAVEHVGVWSLCQDFWLGHSVKLTTLLHACFRPSPSFTFFFLLAPLGKLVERLLWRPFTILTENRFLLPIYLQAILLSPACLRLHLHLFSIPCPVLPPTSLPCNLKCQCGRRLQNLAWTLHIIRSCQPFLLFLLHLLFLGNWLGSGVSLSFA